MKTYFIHDNKYFTKKGNVIYNARLVHYSYKCNVKLL